MNRPSPRILLGLMFLVFAGFIYAKAQQSGAVPKTSPTPVPAPIAAPTPPPDLKAYDEARRIKDPEKKIEALEKVAKDFPDRFTTFQARIEVLDTLIKNFPSHTDRIRAAAERYLADERRSHHREFKLCHRRLETNGSRFDARLGRRIGHEGSGSSRGRSYEIASRRSRARYQDTLGRIFLKQGKTKQAKSYLNQALINEPGFPSALIALGQLAESGGNHKEALEYLSSAAVKINLKKADRQILETAYRATHKDSLAGLEDLLDDKYRKLNAGIHFDHYQASAKRSNRIALAELFTGSGCGPCVAADLGFDGLLERYSRKDVVVLIYHLHVPLPDPMTNPTAVERGKYYAVGGTPTPVVDGFKLSAGGGTREMTKGFFDRINPRVESQLESPAQAHLTLNGAIEGELVKASVTVDEVKDPSPDLKVHVALAEDEIRYTGENGVRFHPMVVRSLGGKDAAGFALTASGPTKVEWTFDLKAMTEELKKYLDSYEQAGHRGETFKFSEKKFQIDPNNLSLIAFVQNMKTKDVLQTVYVKLGTAATPTTQANVK